MVEYRAIKDDLFVSFYLNGNKNLILANGIPSYITKHNPLVEFCRQNKINLFIPRYPGSFESKEKFSLLNSAKIIEKTIEFVKTGKSIELFNNKEISWNPEDITLVGYSFGAIPSLIAKTDLKIQIILICPFLNKDSSRKKFVEEEFSYIKRAYPNLYNFETEDIIKEYENINFPTEKKFVLFLGKKDTTITLKEINFLKEKYNPKVIEFEGGHIIPLDLLKQELNKS